MMKKSFVIGLWLVAIGFAAFSEPPHNAVETYNSQLADTTLAEGYAATLPVEEADVNDPFYYANGKIATVIPSVDMHIDAEENNRVLWVWAMSVLQGRTVGEVNETPCPDQVILQFLNQSMEGELRFAFKESTASVPVSVNSSLLLAVPPLPLNESNGSDVLEAELVAAATAWYERTLVPNNPGPEGGCIGGIPSTAPFAFVRNIYDRKNFTVDAGVPEYFLLRPVVHEQWSENNRFDSVVAARRHIYAAEMGLDNATFDGARFRSFGISTNGYGVQYIESIRENSTGANFSAGGFVPAVFGDREYTYLYGFNSTYEGIGWHTLTLTLYDDFGRMYDYTEEILSRRIAADGSGENVRPNLPYPEPSPLVLPIVSIGGIFLLAILLRFWKR